jgi:hypothetical protein
MLEQVRQQVQHLRMQDRRNLEMFARRCRAREDEYSGADDRPDPQRRKRHRAQRLLQARLGVLRIGDQLVDRFLGEELVGGDSGGSLILSHQLRP